MREVWFADHRDLIKWAVLVQVARTYGLKTIVQVPYWRPENNRRHFRFGNDRVAVADDAWRFFRDLRSVERLGDQAAMKVRVIGEEFSPTNREAYSDCIIRHLQSCNGPLLLFLDPDTGLQPKRTRGTHATEREVGRAWGEPRARDWLALYQHARRKSDWISDLSQQLSNICEGASVKVARGEEVGSDVAFLCVEKAAG